jgi:hypothetical protein
MDYPVFVAQYTLEACSRQSKIRKKIDEVDDTTKIELQHHLLKVGQVE